MIVKELKKVFTSMAKIKPYKGHPVLENFVVKDGKMIWGNSEIQKVVDVPYKGTFLAPFEKIKKIVGKLPVDSFVDLRADENGTVYLETDNGDQFSFQVVNTFEEYPELVWEQDVKETALTYINKEDIAKLSTTSKFVANDELHPVMNNVYIDENVSVATDTHCIWSEELSKKTTDNFLIDPLAIKVLTEDQYEISGIKSKEEDKDWRWIKIAGEKETVYFRETEGNFPNWKVVFPEILPNEFQLETDNLIKAIESGNIVSSKGIFRFEVEKGKITVSTQDIDYGTAYKKEFFSDRVVVDENNVFGIDSEYLLPMLKAFKSQKIDYVNFKFINTKKAILINGKLIMPFNL